MGLFDNMKSKSDDLAELRTKFDELRGKEQAGQLDDHERQELDQMRQHFEE